MTKKKIWFVFKEASPIGQGTYSRHFFLSEALMRQGHSASVFCTSSHHFQHTERKQSARRELESHNGVNTYFLKGLSYGSAQSAKRILSWFLFSWRFFWAAFAIKDKPDIIVVSSPPLVPVLAALLYKFTKHKKCKVVFELRDIWPKTFIDIGGYSAKHPFIALMRWIEKIGYKKSDGIISTLPNANAHIKTVVSTPFPFTCIPQGADLDYYATKSALPEATTALLNQNKFTVCYAGTLGTSNEVDTLIQAAKIVENKYSDIQFLIVGDGFNKQNLEKQAEGLQNLHFVDRLEKTQVPTLLESCQVLYDGVKNAPIYEYGLSRNKWIDYMHAGKPLLVSFEGYKSMVNESNCGTFVPTEDPQAVVEAILTYYNMPESERNEIGARGHSYIVKNRSFNQLATNLLQFIKKI